MRKEENNHSRNVRMILNNRPFFVPVLAWNLQNWTPVTENRVQFIIDKKGFNGVICVDKNIHNLNTFSVGYVDFFGGMPVLKTNVKIVELIDFINNLTITGHPAPNFVPKPNGATEQNSF